MRNASGLAEPFAPARPERTADWYESVARHELKFLATRGSDAALELRLAAGFRRDAHHPRNRVHSLYLDSPGLAGLAANLAGDFHKTKVRLRWYADAGAPAAAWSGRLWLEVKGRRGTLSLKCRKELAAATGPAAGLDAWVERACAELGLALRPVCWLSYVRRRYTFLAQRSALDGDLRLHWAAPWVRPFAWPAGAAVVEQKGAAADPEPDLLRLLDGRARRQAFSKYAAVTLGRAVP